MMINADNNHKRKSVRLKNFDYSTPGYYFNTICTHHRKNVLGIINHDSAILNETGEIIRNELADELNIKFKNSSGDSFFYHAESYSFYSVHKR